MKKIKKIRSQDVDPDGNNSNFWLLVDTLNEIIDYLNKQEEKKQK